MSSATRFLHIDQPLTMKKGGVLPSFTLAYETWGKLNADRSNAVLILTGLSPSAHVASSRADPSAGWWENMLGHGAPIDTDRFYVISLNSLGSCKGSSGPASTNPETGKPYRLDFPDLCIEDMATVAKMLTDRLEIDQLCTMVGPSMGGMSALAYLQKNPRGARHFLTISSAPNAAPFSIAIRSLQRELLVSDPQWNNGNYDEDHWPETGMRMARKLGMLSYRSSEEWRSRFGRRKQNYFPTEVFGMNYEVESYLEAAARRFIHSFDPCSYLYLSRAMDWFDITEGHSDLPSALAEVSLKTACVLGVKSDLLFPSYQQKAIAEALFENGVDTSFSNLDSLMGHDAFLVDYDHFNPHVTAYFSRIWVEDELAHKS